MFVFVSVSVCLSQKTISQHIIDTTNTSAQQKMTNETDKKIDFHGEMSRSDTGAITGARETRKQ